MLPTVTAAQALAARLLAPLPDRWAHTRTVARHAEDIAFVVGPIDREVFLCAAWLHDIGYTQPLRRTGWHNLDGAIYLLEQDWPLRLAALVGHHCHAEVLAAAVGLADELSQFPRQDTVIADALVYVEMVSGWDGGRVSLQQRLEDLQQSSGRNDDAIATARAARRVRLLTAVERTEHRLQALGPFHGIA
jgi:putative nucleotidyltransferase with HDIG domain